MVNIPWSSDSDAQTKSMWDDGASLRVIAESLDPPRTRNAVAGRVRRLGFPPHITLQARSFERKPKTIRAPRLPPAAFRKPQDRLERLPAPIQPEQPMTSARGPVPFLEANGGCKWPLWRADSLPSQKFVCGASRAQCVPYCREHMAVAYQPMKVRA